MKRREKADRIGEILDELYPEPPIPLDHQDPFTLLVSVLLSALRPVSRLLLRAPALYADDCFDRGLAQRRWGDPASAPTPLAHLALFAGPVTVVESESSTS